MTDTARGAGVLEGAAEPALPDAISSHAVNGKGSATAVEAPPRLRLDAVRKSWRRDIPTLDNVDLTLPAGQLVALAGRNGVGKTTLLRIVAGLIAPDSGSVALDGLVVARDRRTYQSRLGFVSAGQTGLYARLTVDFHLDLCAKLMFVPRGSRRAAIESCVTRFDLGELRRQRVDRLSMGQRQRVRLALGAIHSPRLLLLDEPANSLDDESLELLSRAVEAFLAEGVSVIWCAPSADGISLPVDAVYELRHGKVVRK